MASTNFTDEPRIIRPSGPNYRLIGTVVVIAVFLLGAIAFLCAPLYNKRLEEKAHHAERGAYQGAVYRLSIDGEPTRIELGWPEGRLVVIMRLPNPEQTLVRVSNGFGEQTLRWDAKEDWFGPLDAMINPFQHHKLKLTIETDGNVIWSGKLWAWGIHDSSHHHHH